MSENLFEKKNVNCTNDCNLPKLRCIVADDKRLDVETNLRIIKKAGEGIVSQIEAIIAMDGAEVLKIIDYYNQTLWGEIDFCSLDLDMPNVRGEDVLKELQEMTFGQKTIIQIVSGEEDPLKKVNGLYSHCLSVIQKQHNIEFKIKEVKRMMELVILLGKKGNNTDLKDYLQIIGIEMAKILTGIENKIIAFFQEHEQIDDKMILGKKLVYLKATMKNIIKLNENMQKDTVKRNLYNIIFMELLGEYKNIERQLGKTPSVSLRLGNDEINF